MCDPEFLSNTDKATFLAKSDDDKWDTVRALGMSVSVLGEALDGITDLMDAAVTKVESL